RARGDRSVQWRDCHRSPDHPRHHWRRTGFGRRCAGTAADPGRPRPDRVSQPDTNASQLVIAYPVSLSLSRASGKLLRRVVSASTLLSAGAMRKSIGTLLAFAALAVAGRASDPIPPAIGAKVANFTAKGLDGRSVSLSDFASKKAVVVVVIGTECPVSNL